LRRGLSDAHGVDEGVRDEQEEIHILSIPAPRSMVTGRYVLVLSEVNPQKRVCIYCG
jgi:hypothetical protein